MRILMTTALTLLLSLTLFASPVWAFSSNVEIYFENNDFESHDVDIEYATADGGGGSKSATLDGGNVYTHTFSVPAEFLGGTSTFDAYIYYHDSGKSVCHTTLTVETAFLFFVSLSKCSLSATDLTDNCTATTSTSGTSCKLTFTISD